MNRFGIPFVACALALGAAPAFAQEEEEGSELETATKGQRYITPEQLEERQKQLGRDLGLIPPEEDAAEAGQAMESEQEAEGEAPPPEEAEEAPPEKQILQAREEFLRGELDEEEETDDEENGNEAGDEATDEGADEGGNPDEQ